MKTKNIHQTVSIKAPVSSVYRMLMDPRQHSKLSEGKATITSKPGSKFSVWGGGIHGFTLIAVKNKKLIQAWRSEEWPKDHYTVVSFHFRKAGKGTRLVFDHYGVPSSSYKSISYGWKTYYWTPMKKLLEK